jgi:hypothetical protein
MILYSVCSRTGRLHIPGTLVLGKPYITDICQEEKIRQKKLQRFAGEFVLRPDGEVNLGWETGFEPATFGATDRRSTS